MKKSRRALPSNTAGFEKKSAGFAIEHGGLWKKSWRALPSNTAGFMMQLRRLFTKRLHVFIM
ncbi:hypothetical protein ABLT32_12405 [Bacteroides pyogenes]|uniref:hypothetical protein n=1 Tax=Bacteroides pyogenes TaxID=310300 RepID=UPI004064217D